MTPRRALRIARWEVRSGVDSVDRETAVALVLSLAAIAALVPLATVAAPSPTSGLYQVGIDEGNPYYPAAVSAESLRVEPADADAYSNGEIDVLVQGYTVAVRETEHSRAAGNAFAEAVERYNERRLQRASDEVAAYPVHVTLRFVEQDRTPGVSDAIDASGAEGARPQPSERSLTTTPGGAASTSTQRGTARSDTGAGVSESTADPSGRPDESSTSSGSGTDTGGRAATTAAAQIDEGGGSNLLVQSTQRGIPSAITPPFPLRSLVLAFAFLLPLNLLIQAYGSSILAERIRRRGEPLLASPATRGDIVAGKTLPYAVLAVVITTLIAYGVGGSFRSVLAIAPLAVLFLGATFFAGMIARSYKELTFLTVTISVTLTSFAFVPAVFTDVHPIASISPLFIVVNDLRSIPVDPGSYALATVPAGTGAAALFALGTGIYREEDMFTQKPVAEKFIDALAAPVSGGFSVGATTALFIPFVMVAELFAVAVLFVAPVSLSIPLILGVVAIVEELAKSVHVLAGYQRSVFGESTSAALLLGAASGTGFFVAEKLLVLTQLVGLPDLAVGRAAFAPSALGIAPPVLIVAPLLLHVSTASVSSVAASRGARAYALGLTAAIVGHLAYNLAVVSALA
ncbi:MAG: PrsW family intramembrane metalloprotease [Halanaeroarchaeum sp.]